MTRRRIVSAEENDVHTRWRRWIVYYGKAGRPRAVKRRTNRRERREGADDVRAYA